MPKGTGVRAKSKENTNDNMYACGTIMETTQNKECCV